MNKILKTTLVALLLFGAATAQARPSRGPAPHHGAPAVHGGKPPRVGWGVNITPWGSSVGIGARVGRHGYIGVNLPLTPPPQPVTRTVVVEQPVVTTVTQPVVIAQPQPVVVQPVQQATPSVGILPAYAPVTNAAKTWVEGYWRITRDPDGRETSRVWVPGHWE